MLRIEDNEALCRVGPGTIMGSFMRQYWMPVVYDWELQPDGTPLRVRVLGEDLIAWRDTDGKPGFVAENKEILAALAARTRRCVAVVGFVDRFSPARSSRRKNAVPPPM